MNMGAFPCSNSKINNNRADITATASSWDDTYRDGTGEDRYYRDDFTTQTIAIDNMD